MFNLLRRLLMSYGCEKDVDAWLSKHPDAEVVEEQETDRGRRMVLAARDGSSRTYLTDRLGNVVAVLR